MDLQELLTSVQNAFCECRLPQGSSLLNADRADRQLESVYDSSEGLEWLHVDVDYINKYSPSFCFLDFDGFKYYVAASIYLCLNLPPNLDEEVLDSLISALSPKSIRWLYRKSLDDAFSSDQLLVVYRFLEYVSCEEYKWQIDEDELLEAYGG